ncbi:MAG: MBL fold metallo-hydrolase [Candidatus Omnitrophota bacterium]|nr:MBL fold metallo-hydrolase [Candidatus Omnitrophota bacterium]
MHIIIHRGTKEIGGSCVEIATDKTRLLVDFGMPLVTAERKPFDAKTLQNKSIDELKASGSLPDIKGLYKGDARSIDAILLSHSHLDHYGLLSYIHPKIPVYMSQGAEVLINVSNIFTPSRVNLAKVNMLSTKKSVVIGDLKITPYLVDHSAFDALAFLIEGEGKRVFYSGDFRGHGRKSVLFQKMIDDPPKDIDCLLMEGSMVNRPEQKYKTEVDVQKRIEKILREEKKAAFIAMSSQNIDRIVSAYKACLKTGSIFVIDIYTAFILDKLRKVSGKIPQFNWNNMRVMFFHHHAEALEKAGYRDLLYVYNNRKIKTLDINRSRNKFLIMARDNSIFPHIIKGISSIKGAKFIYSMWEGYLKEEFVRYCDSKGLVMETVHTSGHATVEDLKIIAGALQPKKLIPIHTFEPEKYTELFHNVMLAHDGEPILV